MAHQRGVFAAAVALALGRAVFSAMRLPVRLGLGIMGTLCAYTLAIMFVGGVLGSSAPIAAVIALALLACTFVPREYDRLMRSFDQAERS